MNHETMSIKVEKNLLWFQIIYSILKGKLQPATYKILSHILYSYISISSIDDGFARPLQVECGRRWGPSDSGDEIDNGDSFKVI